MPETRLLSTREAAHRLRVSPRTVLRWVRAGDLDAHKLPGATGALVFDEEVVAAAVAERNAKWDEAAS